MSEFEATEEAELAAKLAEATRNNASEEAIKKAGEELTKHINDQKLEGHAGE